MITRFVKIGRKFGNYGATYSNYSKHLKEKKLPNSMTDDFTQFMNDMELYILSNEEMLTSKGELFNLLQQLAPK